MGRKGKAAASPLTARQFARLVVNTALQSGEITRPDTCERCGAKPGLDRAGRSKIHGHHHDYNKPLEVEWICVRRHNNDNHHHRPLGSAKHNSVLREELIRTVRLVLKVTTMSRRQIAEIFCVSKSTIDYIANGTIWKHVATA